MIKAVLKTRCGAWRHIDIPFPPQPRISIALKPRPVTFNGNELNECLVETREFALQNFTGRTDGYADYLEI